MTKGARIKTNKRSSRDGTISRFHRTKKPSSFREEKKISINYPVYIAASALLVSIVTAFTNIYTSHNHSVSDRQIRLFSEIDDINKMKEEKYSIERRKVESDASATSREQLASIYNVYQTQENVIYSKMVSHIRFATQLAVGLNRDVNVYQLIDIANFNNEMGNKEVASAVYKQALKVTSDKWELVRAMRWYGSFAASLPDASLTNNLFERATEISRDLKGPDLAVQTERIATYKAWGEAASNKSCKDGLVKIKKAVELENKLPRNFQLYRDSLEIDEISFSVEKCKT